MCPACRAQKLIEIYKQFENFGTGVWTALTGRRVNGEKKSTVILTHFHEKRRLKTRCLNFEDDIKLKTLSFLVDGFSWNKFSIRLN